MRREGEVGGVISIFSVFSLFQYLRNSCDELHHLFYDFADLVAKFLSNFKEAHRKKEFVLQKKI